MSGLVCCAASTPCAVLVPPILDLQQVCAALLSMALHTCLPRHLMLCYTYHLCLHELDFRQALVFGKCFGTNCRFPGRPRWLQKTLTTPCSRLHCSEGLQTPSRLQHALAASRYSLSICLISSAQPPNGAALVLQSCPPNVLCMPVHYHAMTAHP